MKIGTIIREKRKELSLTQEQLADLLGVSNKSVSRWESGSYPDVTTLVALARALVEYLGGLNCVAMMTTHYDGVSDAARRHYQVAGLAALDTAAFRAGEVNRIRLIDYRLLAAPPGAPCPRDALRVCRLLDLDEEWMKIFEENS